jgi:hypothetical protein
MPSAALALLLALAGLFAPVAHAADGPTGILKVRSNVDGAEVWVDGALLGKAPLTKYLSVGAHQLRVVADRYDPFVRRIEVLEDKTVEVQAALTPGAGTVEFSGPPGARLTLDGADRGPLPIRLANPGVGGHAWRVEAPKFEPAEGRLDFEAGKNYLIDVPMRSSRGVFVVESTPAGAKVTLDGKDVGVTPLRLEGIEPGNHVVVLSHATLAGIVRAVDTTDGSRGEVKATLPKTGGTLEITTGSPDARVLVDGAPLGSGAKVMVGPLEKGKLKLQVVVGERTVTDTVTVPARGTIALRVAGDALVERKPLVQRWGFWAAVGGVAVAGGTTAAVVAAATAPEPPPAGDTIVVLP